MIRLEFEWTNIASMNIVLKHVNIMVKCDLISKLMTSLHKATPLQSDTINQQIVARTLKLVHNKKNYIISISHQHI